ncbi:MAG TPA: putative cytokinetic ring protein SteA [Halanaerobiales bacterium]|nr:putative cytokinetic ring protein SteA [Halanaerobiales bacterium]
MIRGKVVIDSKTKDLVKRVRTGEIAVIDHPDLDQVAAESLVEKRVRAVFNLSASITGRYPACGPQVLLKAAIPLIDVKQGELFTILNDGDNIFFNNGKIYKNDKIIATGREIEKESFIQMKDKAEENLETELLNFIENTLYYARKEKSLVIRQRVPDIGVDLRGKQVLVVIRGPDYKNDLEVIKSYIREVRPYIIAVDGGADACLERGYFPDIIIGDMDSVSDRALRLTKKVIVHAYPDGQAPGLERIKKMGLAYTIFPAPGTSEDLAMLLAYEKGAALITAVGSHSSMLDFLEKGRKGMASTFLVRLKIGNKLVDAKGVSKLYQRRVYTHYIFQIMLAVLLPLFIIILLSPPVNHFFQLLVLKIRLIFNF